MNSILEGKRGNAYEDEYVVYQLLRLLEGHLSWIQWEDATDISSGVDLFLREGQQTIAIQCKHHAEKSWQLHQLDKVLHDAGRQLSGSALPRVDEFRFISDARTEPLERVLHQAKSSEIEAAWSGPERDTVLKRLGLDPGKDTDVQLGREFCRRFSVALVDMDFLREVTTSSAQRLSSGSDSRALKDQLLRFGRLNLAKPIERVQVLAHLRAANLTLAPDIGTYDVQGALATLREEYVQSISSAAQRLPLERIDQPEVESAVAACRDADRGHTVIVHGAAGCGKSTILATALEALDVPVLALRADRDLLSVRGFSHDPVAMFASYCGDRKGVLLIDQLDQLRVAGSAAQSIMDRVRTWIRRSKECGLVVLVGCRTVDAERDTQLRQLLDDSRLRQAIRIRVQDLPDAKVVSVLSRFGIAAADLGPGLLRLLARPLSLALLLGLRTELSVASRCNTTLDLMRLWWERIAAGRDEFNAILDAMCDFMEDEGRLSCPASLLPHAEVVTELRQNGVLQDDESALRNVRPFHQFLTDTRIAVRWGSERTAQAVLVSIGTKQKQSVAQARRLRLATSLMAERPEIVKSLMESTDVRPLLKRALLTGISDLDQPGADIVRLVKDWAVSPAFAPLAMEWVVHGRPSWAERLEFEINEAWRTERVPRASLLQLLFSIDDGSRKLVDRLLTQWSDGDERVLDQARPLFRADPFNDSEERFQARLRLEALTGRSLFPRTDWQALVASHPDRAVQLIAERLMRSSVTSLTDTRQIFSSDLPRTALHAMGTSGVGERLWSALSDWWEQLPEISLRELESGEDSGPDGRDESSPIVAGVEFLAAALAEDVGSGRLDLETLLASLPGPLRDIDAWLLLTTASYLPDESRESANQFIRWFTSDTRWCWIDLGPHSSTYDLRLPKRALEQVGALATDEYFERLESFLATYPDEWTALDEQWRRLHPNLRGRMAYELLPALPQDRLSERGRRLFKELQRKFGDQPIAGPSAGFVTFPVPDRIADKWTDEVWIEQLRTAPLDRTLQFKNGKPRDSSIFQLSSLLRRLAHLHPSRYLSLAESLDASIPVPAREAIVSALGTTRPPDGRPSEDWAPVDDSEVAFFLKRDVYLQEPEVARALAWAVRERSSYDWSPRVLDRLRTVGLLEKSDDGKIDAKEESAEGFASYRLNDDACVALEALAAIASHHIEVRDSLLPLAAQLADHHDPGRRSSAAVLAIACESANRDEARRILLQAASHPVVAAEWDIAPLLFRCAANPDCTPVQRRLARDLLLRLSASNNSRVEQLAGEAAFHLRAEGIIDDTEFARTIQKRLGIRVAAANAVARALHAADVDAVTHMWLIDTAIDLAREGGQVGAQIVFAFRRGNSSRLLEHGQFLERLLETKSATEFLEPLLVACDRSNHLLPVAKQVLSIIERAGNSRDDEVDGADGLPNLQQAIGLASRLVEEAEASRDSTNRDAALDQWDRLLEANPGQIARTTLNERLTS